MFDSADIAPATAKERPGNSIVQKFLKNNDEGDAFLREGCHDSVSRSMRASLLRYRADRCMKEQQFEKAARLYLEAAETYCDIRLPTQSALSNAYQNLSRQWDAFDTMACFTGAARALMNIKDYAQALLWLEECRHVSLNIRWSERKDDPLFDWFDVHLDLTHDYVQHYYMHDAFGDVYLKLGNTAGSVYYRFHGQVTMGNTPSHLQTEETRRLRKEATPKLLETSRYRHPEPSLVATLDVVDDKSHVHGSWRKIELKHPGGVGPRMGCAVFVHKGYLYVAGGEKYGSGPHYDEFWRLNLAKADKWQRLEDVPPALSPEHIGYRFAVSPDEKAYYFTGNPWIHYYDLKTQRWLGIVTTPKADGVDWSFLELTDFCMQCTGNRLYVFGGKHAKAQIGCNMLLELDLTTKHWRQLSGAIVPKKADFFEPGPRNNACSWVGKGGKKMYVMFGDADRMAAQMAGQIGDSPGVVSYAYNDFWSWDIEAKKWTREKLIGNPPSARSEMAAVYNPMLDKVITFGGYSPSAPMFQNNESFRYSYYADTFLCDFNESASPPKASGSSLCGTSALVDSMPTKWRQVLTRGFPTYRAQSHLVVDTATGKTCLFSGYVNSEYVPSRLNQISRAFADIWELRINIPGGHFYGVDLAEEARTAKAGPWQRCFSCGSAGPWKKCGGSCHGRVFFCGTQCLKDGWKEHKDSHKCRKLP